MRYKSSTSIIFLIITCYMLVACTGRTIGSATPTAPSSMQGGSTTATSVSQITAIATNNSGKGQCPLEEKDFPPLVVSSETRTILQSNEGMTQTITYYGDSVGCGGILDQRLKKEFEMLGPRIIVNIVPKPSEATKAFALYERLFQARSTDTDVVMLDIIWSKAFADHLVDLRNPEGLSESLKGRLQQASDSHDGNFIQNSTVGTQLIAMPLFRDFGVLYYRKDLLENDDLEKLKTWGGFIEVASRIQMDERDPKGKNDNTFWGFVWQGADYEGLTCNALEWIYSYGGPANFDKRNTIVGNVDTAKALDMARKWIGDISPPGVIRYTEDNALNVFVNQKAAFMRHWPSAFKSISNTLGIEKVGVVPLPSADSDPQSPYFGSSPRSGGVVGGAQLGISKYSRHKEAAIKFALFMTSPEVQAWRAKVGSYYPTLKPEIPVPPNGTIRAVLVNELPDLQNVVNNINNIYRPSATAGADYNAISTVFFQGIHRFLELGIQPQLDSDQVSDMKGILQHVQEHIQRICTQCSTEDAQ